MRFSFVSLLMIFVVAASLSLIAQTGVVVSSPPANAQVDDSVKTQIQNDTLAKARYIRDSLTTELLTYAKSFLGVPYRWAGKSRAGFDCSGYVMTMYAHLGVSLSPSAADMAGSGRVVPDSLIRPGDILFFVNTQRYRSGIGHVGMVYEVLDNDILFIHSACNGGVRFDYLSSPYYKARFYRAERVPLMDITSEF